ncbi:MAG: hypothetical protein IT239_04080 [Bacteroidia bacterium]|nr:hypothetical protein [Bacteroidia bacterium]
MKHFWILLILINSRSLAQDKILMLNGKEINTHIVDTTFLHISTQDKPGNKIQTIDRYRVFSINWSDNESVLYKQDTLIGNFLSEHDMRMFVYGGKDAVEYYKAPYTFWGGVAAGFVGGYVQPLVIIKTTSNTLLARPAFTPIIPIAYCATIGLHWIKINKKHVSNPLYLSEDAYVFGYERAARGKRVQKAIWGSLTGLAVGLAAGLIH